MQNVYKNFNIVTQNVHTLRRNSFVFMALLLSSREALFVAIVTLVGGRWRNFTSMQQNGNRTQVRHVVLLQG